MEIFFRTIFVKLKHLPFKMPKRLLENLFLWNFFPSRATFLHRRRLPALLRPLPHPLLRGEGLQPPLSRKEGRLQEVDRDRGGC